LVRVAHPALLDVRFRTPAFGAARLPEKAPFPSDW
jgi:hypothetical protein